MKKLLVLSAIAQLNEIVTDAREAGYYVIATDYLPDSPAKKLANESWMFSINDVDGIVRKCQEDHIDGVMNYCIDPGQKPYQQICERLELPCVAGKEQFDIMTNKDIFKETCKKFGVGTIPGFTSEDENPSREMLNLLEYPVVVKPVDGRASKGMSKCDSEEELLSYGIPNALANSIRKAYVVEKYMKRQEVVIKYVACDGEIFLTSMSDVYDCYAEEGTRVYMGSQTYPSRYYDSYLQTTNDRVIHMLKMIGIRNGAMSMTGFYDDGVFRFFDPSLRMGGAQDWRIPAYICGVDISKLLTNFAMTGSMGDVNEIRKIDKAFASKISSLFYIDVRPGIVGEITGVEKCIQFDGVVGYHMCHVPGDVIDGYGTANNVAMRFILVCDSWSQMRSLMDHIKAEIKVNDSEGHNMIVGPFDTSWMPG